MIRRNPALALALLSAPAAAMAHPGHADIGFLTGFAHPLGGIDHLLAMLAVGLISAQQTGRVRCALPATFVATMLAGALLGALGLAVPGIEGGIASSVLVLGLLIALLARPAPLLLLPLVGFFALCHGQAHFLERGGASMVWYVTGFAMATLALHLAGFALARWMPAGHAGQRVKRALGGVLAGTGLVLMGS